jgi:transcriptional regulator of acetoin/glycerol metabolism
MARTSEDPHFAGADATAVARARERFLTGDSPEALGVSSRIVASWQRSSQSNIDVDRVVVPYVGDWAPPPLVASAGPVLDALQQQLPDEPVTIILTDWSGLVLDRRVAHHDLLARLDAVSLAPGFSYAEDVVGTNGIGTTISCGEAVLIDGRAHYTESLGQFSCAGVPIRHPTRHSPLGVLDLTSWACSPGAMLMALAKSAARQIEAAILAQVGQRELALFQEYLRISQQSGAPVLAISRDALMMNEHMRVILGPDEQHSITSYATEMLHSSSNVTARTVELPSGRSAHLRCIRVDCELGFAGAVYRIRLLRSDVRRPAAPARGLSIRRSPAPPSLVGRSSPWIRCLEQVRACYEAGEWFALTGEPGTGKRSILRAVHLQHNPTHGFRLLEPPAEFDRDAWMSDLDDALSSAATMVVVAHADQLDEEAAIALVERVAALPVDDRIDRRTGIAITIASSDGPSDILAGAFSRTVDVPPLRHHIEDLPDLTVHLLSRLAADARVVVSDQALAQFARLDWPGNITQLRRVLADVLRRRRSGTIELDDLPAEARTLGHRRLTPIESLERDAIVNALLDNGGKPDRAAAALGLSRATVYRKLKQFGISLPLTR